MHLPTIKFGQYQNYQGVQTHGSYNHLKSQHQNLYNLLKIIEKNQERRKA